jgi:DNA processing protein
MSLEQISALSLFDPRVSMTHFVQSTIVGDCDQSPGHYLFQRAFENIEFAGLDGLRWASSEALRKADEVVEWCKANKATILYPGHPDYPEAFMRREKPPLFLSQWGGPVWRSHTPLAVVGSRDPSHRALEWMDAHLVNLLRKRRDVAIVSGGARGIDQRAHLVSLRLKQPTIVFLPSGLATPYPSEIMDWINSILSVGGAIMSHYHPHQQVRKRHFEGRNRLIAALGKVCLIVEARRRSGSMMTARLARDQDRTVCVVPAFPDDPCAAGGVDLLFDGAMPIRDADDLTLLV